MDGEPTVVVAISAIEHYAYCPRQCGLIYVEQVFDENVYTTRGQIAHERVHGSHDLLARSSSGVVSHRGLPLFSDSLGLIGKADLVEMRLDGPYPVEYKAGRVHRLPAELQLCAQALCLEEMFGRPVVRGAIYRVRARARREVEFTCQLRRSALEAIANVRDLLTRSALPPPTADKRLCRRCSLRDACLPDLVREPARVRGTQSALFRIHDQGRRED